MSFMDIFTYILCVLVIGKALLLTQETIKFVFTSALFIALRIFPTVSVKVLPSILPNFLYKEPKHTTAALERHLN